MRTQSDGRCWKIVIYKFERFGRIEELRIHGYCCGTHSVVTLCWLESASDKSNTICPLNTFDSSYKLHAGLFIQSGRKCNKVYSIQATKNKTAGKVGAEFIYLNNTNIITNKPSQLTNMPMNCDISLVTIAETIAVACKSEKREVELNLLDEEIGRDQISKC